MNYLKSSAKNLFIDSVTLTKKKPVLVFFSLTALCFTFVVIGKVFTAMPTPLIEPKNYTVTTQSFDVNVLARGQIKPERVLPIKSTVSGNKSKLVWLIEDGAVVEQGDVIARFDQAQYMEELIQVEQRVEDAKATYQSSEKGLLIQQEEEKKKIDNAEKQLELAKLQIKDLLNGSGVLQKEKLKLELLQAQRSYNIASEELLDYDLLLGKGHVSKREREKAADNARRYMEIEQIKKKELDNFNKYGWPKLKREVEILEESSEAEYRRSLRLFEVEIQKRKNTVTKSARDLLRAEKQLAVVKSNIQNCTVTAPIAGRVFYKKLPRSTSSRKIQVGDNVWAGQTFMEIPDTQKLILEAGIREFDVAQVKEGQRATVNLDAFGERSIGGVVKRVNTIAEKNVNQGVNRFSVILQLDHEFDGIHVGMSGQAEIKTSQFDDVIAVPNNFIHSERFENWVWLVEGDEKKKRVVDFGGTNHSWRVVLSGLTTGDVISL